MSENKLFELEPNNFEDLLKFLSLIEDGNNTIIIENSKIVQTINKGSAILKADFRKLIGENIDLHILNSKKYLKLLKKLKSSENVEVFDDDENSRFIASNDSIEIYLPKQNEDLKKSTDPRIEDRDIEYYNKVSIQKDERKKFIDLMHDSDYVELLLFNETFKGFHVPETATCSFENEKLNPKQADIKLKSYSFLNIDAESYDAIIGYEKEEDEYWLITVIRTPIINKVFTIEKLSKVNTENLII